MAEKKQRPGRQLSSDKRGNSDADRRGGPKRWQFNQNQPSEHWHGQETRCTGAVIGVADTPFRRKKYEKYVA